MASTFAPTADLSDRSVLGDSRLVRVSQVALLVAFACAIGAGLFAARSVDAHTVAMVWLQNGIFVLTLSLGSLFFLLIQHITSAGWGIAVRRVAEAHAANLRWLWIVLLLPMLWLHFSHREWAGYGHGLALIWPWADMEHLAAAHPAEAAIVSAKNAYLNTQFFLIRAVAYFALWAGIAHWFVSTSRAQDASGDQALSRKMRTFAGPALIVYALTTTFAAFDWIMSLSPAWFSTMFGVYFFAGTCAAGFSMVAFTCLRLQSLGYLRGVITGEHYQDLGKMIWAFGIVFWAYIAFSQYMLIWYGNLPEETVWFLARQVGDWSWVSVALLFGHFIIPFVLFISRWTKRWKATLAFGCIWMLAFAWLDIYWLVVPVVPSDVATFTTYEALAAAYEGTTTGLSNPLNFLMLGALLGLTVGLTARRLSKGALVCRRDPRFEESLRFENI